MGGGGAGDIERASIEAEGKKQRARNALNAAFGTSPLAPPNPDDYLNAPSYQAALQDYEQAKAEAGKNQSAIQGLYQGVRDSAFNAGKRGLTENYDRAARDNKFALFAQGLNGGSVDVDENALLKRTLDQGLLDLGAKADAAKADFQGNDESTRLGLLQSIDAGMDQGSALSSALNQMKVNSARASAEAQGTSLGDLFGEAGLLYTKTNAARGRQAADNWWQNYMPARGSRGSNGIITPTGG